MSMKSGFFDVCSSQEGEAPTFKIHRDFVFILETGLSFVTFIEDSFT